MPPTLGSVARTKSISWFSTRLLKSHRYPMAVLRCAQTCREGMSCERIPDSFCSYLHAPDRFELLRMRLETPHSSFVAEQQPRASTVVLYWGNVQNPLTFLRNQRLVDQLIERPRNHPDLRMPAHPCKLADFRRGVLKPLSANKCGFGREALVARLCALNTYKRGIKTGTDEPFNVI